MPSSTLTTERLKLRPWRDEDLEPWAAMNADPRVREFFVNTLTFDESARQMRNFSDDIERQGFGLWAVEVTDGAPFIGFIGLTGASFFADFMPDIEIGWRLACPHWGHGYATEGARAALTYGFESLGLKEIVATTAVGNQRSRRVMERLGMTRNPADDFEHPNVPEGHPLRRHVLYRIRADR
jgi:RimJ/RimL family protein N-acetyltransferase